MDSITNVYNSLKEKFNSNQTIKQIFSNTSWLLLEKISQMALGFLVGVWMARYLGPEKYGYLNLGLSIVTIIYAVAPLGLIGFVIKELVKKPDSEDEILGTVFYTRLVSGLVFSGILVIVTKLIFEDNLELWILVSILSIRISLQSFEVIDLLYQARVSSKYAVYCRSIAFFLSAILKVLLILMKAPLILFTIAITLEFVAVSLCYLFMYSFTHKMRISTWKFNFKMMKQMLKESWPLIFSGFAAIIYLKIDQIMLQYFSGEKAVGIYAAATKLSEVWYVIPTLIVSSIFPALIKQKEISENLYKEKLQMGFDFLFILASILALFFTFFSDFIIRSTYGSSYMEASQILKIHIWAGTFIFLRALYTRWSINENLAKLTLISDIMGAIFNILLNVVLIPNYGAMGAAIATVLSYSVSVFWLTFLSKKSRYVGKMMFLSIFSPFRYFLKGINKLQNNNVKDV